MADEISIGKQAIKEVQDLRAELVKLSEDALKAGKNLSSISTPGALNKNGGDNAKIGAELDALKAKYVALNETIAKKAEQSRLAEIRLQQQREKAFDSFEKNAKKEEQLLKKAEGNYQRIQNSVNLMTKAYNDLAIRRELGGTLTEREEKQLASLQKRIVDYNAALLKVDSQIGKNQRNVGNYASGYNALGNSISQLSRELPAFANSAQTGFMAISNNIPAFQDAIMQMRKGGMSWGEILRNVGSSLLGLTGIISLATTALVVLGPKFIDWINNTEEAEAATNRLTDALKLKNDQLDRAINGIKYQEQIDVSLAKRANKNAKDIADISKKSAIDQVDAAKKVTEGLDSQIFAMRSYMNLADDNARFSFLMRRNDHNAVKTQIEFDRRAVTYTEQNLKLLTDARVKAYDKEKTLRDASVLQSIEADTDIIVSARNKDKKTKEDVTPKVKGLDSSLKSVGTVIAQINEEISRLTTEKILADDSALPAINFQLKQLVKLKDQIQGMPEVDLKIVNTTTKSKEAIKQLSEEMKNYLKTFSIDFAQSSGFTETFALLNDEIDGFGENFSVTFNAIAESAQEVFNFISNASQANFDAEKERLQSQYDTSLEYAGNNKEAQEKLADDLELHKKEIANRENKAKQKQAIFNIAIDTAQGVVSALASTPPNVPLSIAIGAIGLAQIALVSSKKVPQYWMGGTHDGGLMMVNDGAGSNYRETIVTPDGKITQPTGRNVLMDAPAGTEIFTNDQWNDQLNSMLQGNGINWHNHQQSNGISKADLEDVMLRTIGNQPNHHTNFDGNGVVKFIEKRGNRTRQTTNRGNGKGIKFT